MRLPDFGALVTSLAAVAWVGCSPAAEEEPVRQSAQALETSPPPTVAEACLASTYVGVKTVAACPIGGGKWKVTKAFPNALEPLLANHCVYTWTDPSTPDPALLPAMGGSPASAWLARDCLVAAPLADYEEAKRLMQLDLAADVRARLGAPASLPTGPTPRSSVRVAVIDTSPTSSIMTVPVLGSSVHGYGVARLIEDVACGEGGACPVQVPTWLGLPRTAPDAVDTLAGGHFGSQLDVAQAIWSAVRAWRDEPPATRPAKLIVNLSLGWEPMFGGLEPVASLPGPARAVYSALAYASCSQALVIAAAGNDGGGPSLPYGPMFPAGWETRVSPTSAECFASFGGGFPGVPASGYRPLVHAVGALGAFDDPAISARVNGAPRLVAHGTAAAAKVAAGTAIGLPGGATAFAPTDLGTAPRTGSSMSAAAVSGTAALIWSYRPSFQVQELMDLLHAQATVLSAGNANFCQSGTTCQEVRRLSTCKALQQVCILEPTRCAAPPVCSSPAPGNMGPPVLSAATLAAMEPVLAGTPITDLSFNPYDEVIVPECAGAIAIGPAMTWNPCVNRQFHGEAAVPFAIPQPGTEGNPDMPLAYFERWDDPILYDMVTLFLSRDATRGYVLKDSTLILTDSSGARLEYTLGEPMTPDEPTLQFRFPVRPTSPTTLADAAVAFTTGDRSASIVTAAAVAWR